jgi:hypothetical protein
MNSLALLSLLLRRMATHRDGEHATSDEDRLERARRGKTSYCPGKKEKIEVATLAMEFLTQEQQYEPPRWFEIAKHALQLHSVALDILDIIDRQKANETQS